MDDPSDDYGCLICQRPSVIPTAYCDRCGKENQHMNPSAMSDFNKALAKLNAVLNLDGKAAIQSLRELTDRQYEGPQDLVATYEVPDSDPYSPSYKAPK